MLRIWNQSFWQLSQWPLACTYTVRTYTVYHWQMLAQVIMEQQVEFVNTIYFSHLIGIINWSICLPKESVQLQTERLYCHRKLLCKTSIAMWHITRFNNQQILNGPAVGSAVSNFLWLLLSDSEGKYLVWKDVLGISKILGPKIKIQNITSKQITTKILKTALLWTFLFVFCQICVTCTAKGDPFEIAHHACAGHARDPISKRQTS